MQSPNAPRRARRSSATGYTTVDLSQAQGTTDADSSGPLLSAQEGDRFSAPLLSMRTGSMRMSSGMQRHGSGQMHAMLSTELGNASSPRPSSLHQIAEMVIVGDSDTEAEQGYEPDEASSVPRLAQLPVAADKAASTSAVSTRPGIVCRIAPTPNSPKTPGSPSPTPGTLRQAPARKALQPKSPQGPGPGGLVRRGQPAACASPSDSPTVARSPSMRMTTTRSSPSGLRVAAISAAGAAATASSPAYHERGSASPVARSSPFSSANAGSAMSEAGSSVSIAQHPTAMVRHLRRHSVAGQASAAVSNVADDIAELQARLNGGENHLIDLEASIRHGASALHRASSQRQQDTCGDWGPESWDTSQAQLLDVYSGARVSESYAPVVERELQELQRLRSSLGGAHRKPRSTAGSVRSARSSWSGSVLSGAQPVSNCRLISMQRQAAKPSSPSALASIRHEYGNMPGGLGHAEVLRSQRASHTGEVALATCLLAPGEPQLPKDQPATLHTGPASHKFEYRDSKAKGAGFKARVLPTSHQVSECSRRAVWGRNRVYLCTMNCQWHMRAPAVSHCSSLG